MRADEWKAVAVIVYGGQGNAPPANGVALPAVTSHLATMKVRVTIGAPFPDVAEYKFPMALAAIQSHVHSGERIPGLGMVEVGEGPDRAVAGGRMAVSACDPEGAVRALDLFLRYFRIGRCRGRLMQRVAPGTRAACGTASQGRMPAVLLILLNSAVTGQAFERVRVTWVVMTGGAVIGTAQHGVSS
jgi:hypothetical protein